MSKTIEQLQAFINTDPDLRQLVNEIADYLQANPGGGGGGTSILQTATVTLTDAQIKALPTDGFDIVAAPGVGKMIMPIRSFTIVDFTGGIYTNLGDTEQMKIRLVLGIGQDVTATNEEAWVFEDDSQVYAWFNDPTYWLASNLVANQVVSDGGFALSDLENKPLRMKISSTLDQEFTGGNAANTLKVTVYYVVVDL